MPPKKTSSTPVTSIKHAETRANIPTEELRDFVADEERNPKNILYPRDPSLDPQLVWKGKDEQDNHQLEVQSVPIYIQEKISPQAIVENVRAQAQKDRQVEEPPSLFADFNNINFTDLVDFYHHEQNWTNRLILGDNLLVMTSLADKEGLKGKVQMIYIDPPYGIKFGSNWQVSTRKRDIKDGKLEDATRQPEQIQAFRDTWKLGIHSYLIYLRDRLVLAKDLLTESGSIFLQIGDENVHLVRCVMDEVLGSENFVSLITFATTSGFESSELARGGDYILWYAKNKQDGVKVRPLFEEIRKEAGDSGYRWVMFPDEKYRGLTVKELNGEAPYPKEGKLYKPDNILSQGVSSGDQSYVFRGKPYSPGSNNHWKANYPNGMRRLALSNRLHVAKNSLQYIRYADDFSLKSRNNIWVDTLTGQYTEDKIYVVQTNTKVIERCMLMTTDPGDLVLDPTCGSGTTAFVAEQWGRRWITIDTSRVAIALTRTRLMAGRYSYYLLSDSPDGIRKASEIYKTNLPSPMPSTANDVRKGFVNRRVPHITLKSIANNEEIDAVHTRWQERLRLLLSQINAMAGTTWQEWDVPHELPKNLQSINDLERWLVEWWQVKSERQKEIDKSINSHADPEQLFDQPYDDNKRIRVTGPFTVESLSPHRILSTDDDRPASEITAGQQSGTGQFEAVIIDNLRAAGVQNTKKTERLKFTRLELYAGMWIHASGEYQDKDGNIRRVAVTIGPEHGTVGPELVKEAAKESVQGIGFDLLVVLGFAFDAHVSEEARRYGKLNVLPALINPDLQMGGELLKKTGYGNLFMVFGEPDVDIQHQADNKLTVTIRGVDIYDPTTGEIRSSSTDDIACWFIDSDYDGESFFVRHAYFTGADDPYEKLKRALRAEVDETAWNMLYTATSRPFDKPVTGKIAVKVINHYGDEVLKVYPVT
jgi:adenine-specific DNA-methyltransferase